MKGSEPGTPARDRFNPFRIGLDHIALGCENEAGLQAVAEALRASGIENSGIKSDPQLKERRYVAFKDPDGIAWEFYRID
jgi:catechol 2,3-dioxygenase-like lactoylglutathione lyase family enzyme